MSSYKHSGGQPPAMASTFEKVDLIWQMGLASLAETDHELRLPVSVSDGLSREEISYLENRLSDFLGGAPVVSFNDASMNIYRVLRMPEMQTASSSPTASMSPAMSAASFSSPSAASKPSDPNARQYGKKSRIPRPPNAFILYRQKHHPLLKAQNPELHNNDISVILGQQWKKEDMVTRIKFKAMAEEIKRKHLIKFPGYQYTPRKPSEKKRRMTARKLAKLPNNDAHYFPASSGFPGCSRSEIDHSSYYAGVYDDNAATQTTFEDVPTLENILGLNQQATNTGLQSQITATAPNDPADFLNSLVDYEAFDQMMQVARDSFDNDQGIGLVQRQGDRAFLPAATEEEVARVDAAIERNMVLFE